MIPIYQSPERPNLDSFVIDQRIDSDIGSLVIGLISFTAEACPTKRFSYSQLIGWLTTHRHAVVLTVNQVYAAMVKIVIAAKFHPKL